MHQVQPQIFALYEQILHGSDSPTDQHRYYRKWLRYYWDFCHKYTLEQLTTQIKTRHYSPKTLKAYLWWTHKLQNFTQDKNPQLLSVDDVSAFLSDLAIERHVSASSQNQAFYALLVVFQHILKKNTKAFITWFELNINHTFRKPIEDCCSQI